MSFSGTSGILAQLGEHLPYEQRVTGSSPVGPIKSKDLNTDGEVAQLARACGSYPQCRGFKSLPRYSKALKSLYFTGFFCLYKNRFVIL